MPAPSQLCGSRSTARAIAAFASLFPASRFSLPFRFLRIVLLVDVEPAQTCSNLDDHVLQAGGIGVQHFALVFPDDDRVRVPKAAPIGIVNPGLATESHALLQNGLVALGDPWSFMAFEANAVPGAMFQKLLKACLANLVQTFLVHFFSYCAFLQVFDTDVMGREHGVEQAPGVIGRF